MMKFNALVLLGVLFAAILICSTAVAQKSEDEENTLSGNYQETNDVKEPAQNRRCRFGCCRSSRYGCVYCCRPGEKFNEGNEETADVKEPEQYGRPLICRHGCCRRGRFGCIRCCRTEHEAKETYAASGDGNKVAGTATVNP